MTTNQIEQPEAAARAAALRATLLEIAELAMSDVGTFKEMLAEIATKARKAVEPVAAAVEPQADHCPKCGSDQITWDGYDIDGGGYAKNEATCSDCGCEFDQYDRMTPEVQRIRNEDGSEGPEINIDGPSRAKLVEVFSRVVLCTELNLDDMEPETVAVLEEACTLLNELDPPKVAPNA